MTLCAVWCRPFRMGEELVVATDSRITGGYSYDFGTKLVVFNRQDCVLCWEGSTSYTYSFVVHAKSDIDWSDVLSNPANSDIYDVQLRISDIFNHMWAAALKDKNSMFREDSFSFIFGGYSTRRKRFMAWHLSHSVDRTRIEATPIDLQTPHFIGSGAGFAQKAVAHDLNLMPLRVLRMAIEDPALDDVGGVPQITAIRTEGVRVFGVVKNNARYLFGREVQSSGHAKSVEYIRYDLDELPSD